MSDKTKKKPLPSFIKERLNFYIQDLITQNESQKHLGLGKRPPRDAVVMQSNDYLALSHNKQIQQTSRTEWTLSCR
mgnify:CR=1 FL=1